MNARALGAALLLLAACTTSPFVPAAAAARKAQLFDRIASLAGTW